MIMARSLPGSPSIVGVELESAFLRIARARADFYGLTNVRFSSVRLAIGFRNGWANLISSCSPPCTSTFCRLNSKPSSAALEPSQQGWGAVH
jgi:hypothetical protein